MKRLLTLLLCWLFGQSDEPEPAPKRCRVKGGASDGEEIVDTGELVVVLPHLVYNEHGAVVYAVNNVYRRKTLTSPFVYVGPRNRVVIGE